MVEDGWGLSTMNPQIAARHRENGFTVSEMQIEVTTLAELCSRHSAEQIDFLKLDIEGSEREVLAGNDWSAFRPRVVLVEATEPGTRVPSYELWEPILLGADYQFALFDGLNRFYVRTEDADELEPLIAAPATIFDDFIPVREAVTPRSASGSARAS